MKRIASERSEGRFEPVVELTADDSASTNEIVEVQQRRKKLVHKMYIRLDNEQKRWLADLAEQFSLPVSRLVCALAVDVFTLPWGRLIQPPLVEEESRLNANVKITVDAVTKSRVMAGAARVGIDPSRYVRLRVLHRLEPEPVVPDTRIVLLPTVESRALGRLFWLIHSLLSPPFRPRLPDLAVVRRTVEKNGLGTTPDVFLRELSALEHRTRAAFRFGGTDIHLLAKELDALVSTLSSV